MITFKDKPYIDNSHRSIPLLSPSISVLDLTDAVMMFCSISCPCTKVSASEKDEVMGLSIIIFLTLQREDKSCSSSVEENYFCSHYHSIAYLVASSLTVGQ
jgi:hypothetical protein